MIFKIISVLAVLFVVYLVFFKKSRESVVKQNNQKRKDKQPEDVMVECPTCKTFVSKDDAILSSGKFYCTKECLK